MSDNSSKGRGITVSKKLIKPGDKKYFVMHETRIGEYGIEPRYYVYGPYTSAKYARKIIRDLAQIHGGHVWRGMNEYTHRHYYRGLLNWHNVSVVEVQPFETVDGPKYYANNSRGVEVNITHFATKYNWK